MALRNVSQLALDDALAHLLAPQGTKLCLLLVASHMDALVDAVAGLEARYGWPRLTVGRELSAVLLQEPPDARGRMAERWLQDQLRASTPGPVLCSEIDVLFVPALHLDPLALFRRVGRVTRLVVAWPGSYREGVLAYAAPDHQHYRTWKVSDVLVASVET